ncbi:Chitinase A1 precursor [Streptomyces sp. YIM 130001]|uniref:fibronectin type III domain-containing protein n=1 Tax=Streptomyces sp. YIM 130001 TaxID=2259644 RepID=UPI000EDE77FF|nr:fibronectin type III domain-containing protein [Streptomyces sp. YIM 130001]RII17104.1 Chitinase A1 precursor [Streptomyces sp. YIM 130001]
MRRTVRTVPALLVALCLSSATLTGCSLFGAGADGAEESVEPPSAPRGLTVHAGSATSVHVMWNKSPGAAAVDRYEIFRGRTKVKSLPGKTYMADLNGLRPKATYSFRVRALDAEGNASQLSRKATVTMREPAPADDTPPAAPSGLRVAAAGSRAATLTWTPSKDGKDVTSYDVYQRGARIHSVPGGATSALVTGLRPGTDYMFSVKARDAADHSSTATEGVRHTTGGAGGGSTAGTAPADFEVATHAEDGAHHLDLSWDPPRTGGEVSEYRIYLNGRQTTTLAWGADAPKGRAKHSFFISRESGQTYRVKLRARLPDGNWGAFSPERTVTTGEG